MLALSLALLLTARPDAAGDKGRQTIAVLYFDNLTKQGDFDVLRKGMADMIVTDLVAWDGLTVVDRLRLEEVLAEQKLQHTKAFDQGTAVKLGRILGADYLLTGSLNSSGGKVIIDAQLKKVTDSSVVISARSQGDPNHVFDVEQDLVDKVTRSIDVKVKDAGQRKRAKVPDLDALIAYSKAVDLSDQGKVDEANAAISALVSKSPTFIMAREKREQILKHLEELQKLRKDMVTDAVLKIGKLADEAMKDVPKFDTLDSEHQQALMAWHVVKGRYLMRVLKQFVSPHRENWRVVLKGKEGEALKVMRTWAENQRQFADLWARWNLQRGNVYNGVHYPASTSSNPLPAEVVNLLREADMGRVELHDPDYVTPRFVLYGYADDGQEHGFDVSPALGDMDKKEHDLIIKGFDEKFEKLMKSHATAGLQQANVERELADVVQEKAKSLERYDKDEEAIAVLQKFLDAYPTSEFSKRIESRIKQLLGVEHDADHSDRERWADALKNCNDMDIRVGMKTMSDKVQRMGLAGLDAQAAELEKACKVEPKTKSAFDYMYGDLAREAATDGDCERSIVFWKKYIEVGGSASDMKGWEKWAPWCNYTDVEKQVVWFYARLDRDWSLELTESMWSSMSSDKKTMTMSASRHRGKMGNDYISIWLEGGPTDYKCTKAQWQKDDEQLKFVSCDVKFEHLATGEGDHDAGTFDLTFIEKDDGPMGDRKVTLTDGHFRLRRNH
ncbi:MAG: CsgG/HfaB family protein [Myxococcaceae bacterium]